MATTKSLINRLKEVLTEGQWVTGTNWKAEIIDLDWHDATTSINGLNTIAQLTFHIHYYIVGVTAVFKGEPLSIKDQYSFDAPPIKSAEDWLNLVEQFCTDTETFYQYIEAFSDQKLQAVFVDEKYGNYQRNINAMIEHTYYHLGQVLLIKKMIKNQKEQT